MKLFKKAKSKFYWYDFTVRGQRLYNLVKLKSDASFKITVQIPHGISAYDFTFG